MIHIVDLKELSNAKLWQLKKEVGQVVENLTHNQIDEHSIKGYFEKIKTEYSRRVSEFQMNLSCGSPKLADQLLEDLKNQPMNKFQIEREALENFNRKDFAVAERAPA